jgi:hypothetical protein
MTKPKRATRQELIEALSAAVYGDNHGSSDNLCGGCAERYREMIDQFYEEENKEDEDSLFAVIATLKHNAQDDRHTNAVKLARGERKAKLELRRMVGVVLRSGVHVEFGESETWATVNLDGDDPNGATYFFSIERASWAE